jgi:RNA polymerase sigma factor (TIGR02999 family)
MHPSSDPDELADLTLLLRNLNVSSESIPPEMLPALVAELRALARSCLGAERGKHTLQPTALINETFLKLIGSQSLGAIQDRKHFFALSARVMRQILVDYARQRAAGKRGGDAGRTTLADASAAMTVGDAELLDVNTALSELAELDERRARVVELRFFAGLEMDEVAAAMECSLSTVEREWRAARAWLGRRMSDRRTDS